MRYIVFGIILFLPLIVYFTWAYVVTRKKEETGGQWNDGPITRLVIIGLILMGGALVVSRFMNPGEPPGRLVPDQYQDDRFLRPSDGTEQAKPQPRQAAAPPPSPGRQTEQVLAPDQSFLKAARQFLDDFVSSGDIRIVDTLVTRSDAWGPVLRADFRRRIEGRSQPRERIVIWKTPEGGLTAEFPNATGLAPLSAFSGSPAFSGSNEAPPAAPAD
jgi:hypothetical protein